MELLFISLVSHFLSWDMVLAICSVWRSRRRAVREQRLPYPKFVTRPTQTVTPIPCPGCRPMRWARCVSKLHGGLVRGQGGACRGGWGGIERRSSSVAWWPSPRRLPRAASGSAPRLRAWRAQSPAPASPPTGCSTDARQSAQALATALDLPVGTGHGQTQDLHLLDPGADAASAALAGGASDADCRIRSSGKPFRVPADPPPMRPASWGC